MVGKCGTDINWPMGLNLLVVAAGASEHLVDQTGEQLFDIRSQGYKASRPFLPGLRHPRFAQDLQVMAKGGIGDIDLKLAPCQFLPFGQATDKG